MPGSASRRPQIKKCHGNAKKHPYATKKLKPWAFVKMT